MTSIICRGCCRGFFGFIVTLLVLSLAACGGGGGGGGSSNPGPGPNQKHTISGTAAAGAPIVGYVSVYDSSSNTQPVLTNIPIDANGNYTVDVTGLAAPYAFLATGTVGGREVSLYSAATATDVGNTIDITPFTDLMIRNLAAAAVDAYVDGGGLSGLTAVQLDAQRVALTNALAPALEAMGLSSSIDLLRATFNADDTGLDAFMDVVKVNISGTTATITNILDAANTLIIDTSTDTFTGTLGTVGLATSSTALDGIKQTLATLTAQFATQLPEPTDPALTGLFTTSFLNDGENLTAFLGDISDPGLIGATFIATSVESLDTNNGIAQVSVKLVYSNGVALQAITWQMKLVGGVWKIDGDQRIAFAGVYPVTAEIACNPADTGCVTPTSFKTGLDLSIDSMGGNSGLYSAVVTGPGLPVDGVTLQTVTSSTSLAITTSNALCGSSCGDSEWWLMSDTDIAAMPVANASYTVKLYDSGNNLLATYTDNVIVPPPLNTSLSTLTYPSLSGMVDLNGLTSATLTPSWTMPTGITPYKVEVFVLAADSEHQSVAKYLRGVANPSSGTATLVVNAPTTGTWTSGQYTLRGYDANGTDYTVIYQ